MFWTDYNHESNYINNELDLNVNPDASVSSECSTEREDLEFQANAAAALLFRIATQIFISEMTQWKC